MKKNKILMCGSDLSNGGGVVAVTQNLLEYPDWGNYEIIYISTHINGNKWNKIKCFINGFNEIRKLIRNENINLAHLHTCDGGPFYRKGIIARYLKCKGVKVVLHHHTDYSEFFSSLNGLKKTFVKRTLIMADNNIVLGDNLVNVIKKFEYRAKISVLYNGVYVPEKRLYCLDGKYIVFMGWLLERKGIFDLMNAIEIIDERLDPTIKLALCGFGDNEIVSKIMHSKVSKRIEFIGWADNKMKDKILRNAVLNILPSYREGAPMTILEAMSYGIPCVASSISTIPEIISNGINGVLIETHSPEEIGNKILELINNRSYREDLSIKAYESIKDRFSISRQVNELIELYDGLVK